MNWKKGANPTYDTNIKYLLKEIYYKKCQKKLSLGLFKNEIVLHQKLNLNVKSVFFVQTCFRA